jgi:hypothetical protein
MTNDTIVVIMVSFDYCIVCHHGIFWLLYRLSSWYLLTIVSSVIMVSFDYCIVCHHGTMMADDTIVKRYHDDRQYNSQKNKKIQRTNNNLQNMYTTQKTKDRAMRIPPKNREWTQVLKAIGTPYRSSTRRVWRYQRGYQNP